MKTYAEFEKYFEEVIVKDKLKGPREEGEAFLNQAEFYYYCGLNIWCFEMNRLPFENPPLPLHWKDPEELYTFFGTVPKDLTFTHMFEKAEASTKKSLEIFNKIADSQKQKADAYLKLILICDYLNKPKEEAISNMDNAYKLYAELGDKEGMVGVIMQRAYMERYRSYDMQKTRDYLQEAILLYKETKNKSAIGSCLNKIADTYYPSGMGANLELWEKYNNESTDCFIEDYDTQNAVIVWSTMVDYFDEAKNEKKRDEYMEKIKKVSTA